MKRLLYGVVLSIACALLPGDSVVRAARSSPYTLVKHPQNVHVFNRTTHGTVNDIPSMLDETDLTVYLGRGNAYPRTAVFIQSTYWRRMPEAWTEYKSAGIDCHVIRLPPAGGKDADWGGSEVSGNCNTESTKVTDAWIKVNDWAISRNEEYDDDPQWFMSWLTRHEFMHALGFLHNAAPAKCGPISVINTSSCFKWQRPDDFYDNDIEFINQYY